MIRLIETRKHQPRETTMRASEVKVGDSFTRALEDGTYTRLAPSLPPDALSEQYRQHVWASAPDGSLILVHADNSVEPVAGVSSTGGVLPFHIEHHDNASKQCSGRVEISDNGIEVFFDGYGMHGMKNGAPLFIEVGNDGHPVAHVWAEIDGQDPTHNISFAAAKESK